jgi:hypothetical protein
VGRDRRPARCPGTASLAGGDPGTGTGRTALNYSQQQRVNNLSVSELHTYYVEAGTTPVLVHNCPADNPGFFKRLFGGGGKAGDPAPNAKVDDLRNMESDGSYDPVKEGIQRSLTDDQLKAAARQTQPPDVMYTYDGTTIGNGNHRMRELLRRADSPDYPGITDETSIYILGFGE